MNRTYQKNILRTLASSRGRFLSIFSIVALGVGFLAGLVSSTPNMRLSVETYLDSADFYDLRVLGTLGLTDDDVQALAAVEGVESVRPAYSADLLVDTREADSVVARVHSLPEGGDGAQGACVNRLQLTEGRWPQSSGECVVEAGAGDLARGLEIGDVITVPAEDNEDLGDKLAVTQFTVVGAVHDATYFSFEREPASVGSGAVQTIFYILPQDFSYEAYTEIYLTAAGAKELDSLDTAYEDTVQAVSDAVEGISGARCEARYTELTSDAQKEIDDAWDEYNEAAEEAQTELADAARELADGREALANGAQELADGEREYQDGLAELADYEQQLADGEEALNAGEAELIEGQAEWDSGWQQIVDGEKQLSDAKKQLDDAQAQYDQGAAAYADALAQLEAGEKELEDGRALLEQSQKQYEDGLAQWEQGKEQLDQLRQLQQGEAAYYDGIRQLAEQLQQAGLPVTEEQLQELIAELAAQDEEMPTEEEFLQMVLDWLLDREQGEEDAAVAAVRQALAALRAAQEAAQPSTPETAALDMAPLAEIDAAADEGAASELWQQILDELRGMEDEVPEEMRPYYEELLEAIEQLPQRPDLTDPVRQLYEGVRQLVEARRQLDAGIQAIIDTYAEMGETLTWEQAQALYSEESLAALQEQLDEAKVDLDDGKVQLDAGWAEYEAGAAELAEGRRLLEENAAVLQSAKEQLDAGWSQYEEQGTAFYEGRNQLLDAKKTLDEGWATLADRKLELADARAEIEDARATLADARAELEDARRTIEEKTQELRDGEIEYEDAKAEVEQELADARAEIEDAEAQLADLETGEWYVWDRSRNVSFASFDSNSSKLAALAKVFPVFFFLVAALVVSTTMTRMVEEERLQIGTMKALGYTRAAIIQKYLLYAMTAAVAGALFGLCVGFFVFPRVIWSAYSIMYWVPKFYAPWRVGVSLLSAGSLLLCTLAATWASCRATLHETPAALMRPRAPKAGKRILLERVGFIWRLLPFTYKVTCRNLLRYKRRFWMTVIGVAGCTALLVTGFGISDSLNSIVTKQFGEIYRYDLLTAVTDAQDTQQGPVHDLLFGQQGKDLVDDSLVIYTRQVEQELDDGGTIDFYYMIPQDTAAFAGFADLHERVSGAPTPLTDNGVVLTEKMAATLGVQAGDTVTLDDGDGELAEFTVTGVCEHYVYNYVYVSAAGYAAAFGSEPEWNAVMSRLTEDSQQARDTLSARLLALDEVASLNFTQDSKDMVLNMLGAIDAVVALIIICAASLAFVVLYNLTNINIAERVKEIATIKVLGFYDREVDAYVNRESVALTLIGALFGLAGGVVLHRFVILTVEVDAVMFGRDIEPLSFAYALALTFVFSLMVNLVMGRKLKHISMVESMKAPE